MELNFTSNSNLNFTPYNNMTETFVVRFEEEDEEIIRLKFKEKNPFLPDEFDELLEKNIKHPLPISIIENSTLKLKDEIFKLNFSQNFYKIRNLKEIDLYFNKEFYVSEKKEIRLHPKNFYKILKNTYKKEKVKEKEVNECFDENLNKNYATSAATIFDNYTSNDKEKYFNPDINIVNKRRKSNPGSGYVSSLSILTQKNDIIKRDRQLNLKSIILENEKVK